jgi:hypothetical protein
MSFFLKNAVCYVMFSEPKEQESHPKDSHREKEKKEDESVKLVPTNVWLLYALLNFC